MSRATPDIVGESFPAQAESVPLVRRLVSERARQAGLTEEQIEDARLAVSEAAANVVLHAYPEQPGALHVTAAVAGQEFWVLIGDDGEGLRARRDSPGLGLGLSLMAELTDELAIDRGADGGTQLRMRFRIPQPAGPRRARKPPRSGLRTAPEGQSRGLVASATSPASPSFSTTT